MTHTAVSATSAPLRGMSSREHPRALDGLAIEELRGSFGSGVCSGCLVPVAASTFEARRGPAAAQDLHQG